MGMEYLILGIIVVAVVVALSAISDRLGIAPPLILMLVGVGISFLPFVQSIVIQPEWILEGVLPPLLYATAIAMPTVDLRRDFSAIGGLSVILVVISAVLLGLVLHWLIPDISLPMGIALGAILSPTDAAATTIVKRLGVPGRVRIILQGESLLNDATSLVILRSAVAAIAVSVSFWHVIGSFLWAAAVAAIIGIIVGWAGVRIRQLIHDSAAATAISILIPFVAYFPTELCHASGFVAVVAAGLTAAQLGPTHLEARQRVSEQMNWHTIEFLLEGAVFLGMGLELYGLMVDLHRTHEKLWLAFAMAGLAIVMTLVIRWVYLDLLLHGMSDKANRQAERTEKLRRLRDSVRPASTPDQPESDPSASTPADKPKLSFREAFRHNRNQALRKRGKQLRTRMNQADPATRARFDRRMRQLRARFQRYLADVDYLIHQPLGIKEGTLLTWAGMRGVVTLAAAQTLPQNIPHRSLLIVIAFLVAAGSLVLQGGTLPWLVKVLGLAGQDGIPEGEWDTLQEALDKAADEGKWDDLPPEQVPLAKVRAKRQALLDLRSTGTYSSHCLSLAMTRLDAQEISLQAALSAEE